MRLKITLLFALYVLVTKAQVTKETAPVLKKSSDISEVEYESKRLNEWFEQKFEENLMDSPEQLTTMGRKERKGELDDISEAHALQRLEKKKKDLAELLKFDTLVIDDQTKLSYTLYRQSLEDDIKYAEFRHYNYPVNQMHGMQSELPSFMMNMHSINNEQDAKDYISRLNAFKTQFDQLIEGLKIREKKNIIVPKFVFAHLYNDCKNIMGDTSRIVEQVLYKDFTEKVDKLNLNPALSSNLKKDAEKAVKSSVIPSYQKLIIYLKTLEPKAPTDAGVWRFNKGSEFYNYRLYDVTTTNLTADQIFKLGESEVKRIHGEMNEIIKKTGFSGSLQDFFQFTKEDKRFYYENGDAGKQAALARYTVIIDSMKLKLNDLFLTLPKAGIIVKAVEPYREKSAGKAFYQNPAEDGSRPGIFYANLYKMEDMPKYEMEALAFHEGIPGHHMQLSISQEMTGIPKFRKYSHYTAYIEGWGLYSELLGKEVGFYKDPYSDFGRLAMELWRACRLTTDAGLHYKKWTREQAIDYLVKNTPSSENACVKAIERYIVMPGQATAYKVGMIKIVEMKTKAEKELGSKFDIRKFHDIFLLSGPVPLNVFEKRVNDWIAEVKKS